MHSAMLGMSSASTVMAESFGILAVEGVFFAVLIMIKYGRSGIYIFEPFTIVTLSMVLVYFVAPVFQFEAGSTSRYGVDISQYCLNATTLVMVGYLSFFLMYEFNLKARQGKKKRGVGFKAIEFEVSQKLVKLAYAIWAIAYLLNVYYYINKGFDIVYIVTGGLTGEESNSLMESDSMAFLAYAKFILLGAWMMIYAYGSNRPVKVLLYILMLLNMFLGGGRLTLMIAILAPIVFSFGIRKESPRFSAVSLSVCLFILLFAFMQVARVGLRTGAGIDMGNITLNELFNPFYAEIDDFKSFYILLGVVPDKHEFLLGSQMLFYSLALLIPRAIWPGKPDPAVYDIVFLSFGERAVANGNAYPAIGEYYIEFGLVGVVVLMGLLGVVCRSLKNCYLETQGKSLAMMVYAIVFPSMLSIVIRGYFPQNFSMLLFLLAPLVLFRLLIGSDSDGNGSLMRERLPR